MKRFLNAAGFTAIIFVMLMTMMLTAFANENEDTTVTFGVISDIHNNTNDMKYVMDDLATIAGGKENIDGLALVGDIIYLDTGVTASSESYAKLKGNEIFSYFYENNIFSYAMGNHEFTLNATLEDKSTETAIKVFEEEMNQTSESDKVIGGYHFITAGPRAYDGVMTAEQEQYVMTQIKAALAEDENKPVFVLIHHPVDGTIYGTSSSDRNSDEFVEFLKAQPRVVVFSGHNHYSISNPRSIYQVEGGATFLYTSAVNSGNNLNDSYASQRHDKAHPSQGYLMQIDTNENVVTLKRFYVTEDNTPSFVENGDWVLDIPAMVAESQKAEGEEIDLGVYKYTYGEREANSVAPVYAEDKEITLTAVTTQSATISFPEAAPAAEGEDNMVGYYKIEVYNRDTEELLITYKRISDYFMEKDNRRASYSYSFEGLTYATAYRVSVTPLNMWYKEGTPLTFEFISAGLPAGLGKISGYDDSYYAAEITLNETGDGRNIDTANAFQINEENNRRLAGLYAVSSDDTFTGDFDVVYVYGSGETREALYAKSSSGKFVRGTKNKFIPGKFTSNVDLSYSDKIKVTSEVQWYNKDLKAYFFATDDEEGTEGAKTKEQKQLEILKSMIDSVKESNPYVAYTLTPSAITPISEVNTLKFGFHLYYVYSSASMTIKNNQYRFVAYVMDKDGKVTTHATNSDTVKLQTVANNVITDSKIGYQTFNFETAEWDEPLPADGYFVGFKIYPYYGVDDPEDITLTTTATTEKEFEGQKFRFSAVPSTFTVDIPKAKAPTGITMDGTTFNGLDRDTTYSVAPYYVNGADDANAVEVTGVTSYTLPEGSVGLYGIYIKGDNVNLQNSDAYITYARGSYSARKTIHDLGTNDCYKMDLEIIPGYFSYTGSENNWATHSSFKGGISSLGTHISSAQWKTFYEAYNAVDATEEKKRAAFEAMLESSDVQSEYLQYNMAADEIVPISEVSKYSYKVDKQQGGFIYNNQVSEFVALVMHKNGDVKEYTYQHVAAKLGSSVTKTVDFKNAESDYGKWVDTLPKEGYLVGFKYLIYANLDTNLDSYKNAAESTDGVVNGNVIGTRYRVYPGSIVIDTYAEFGMSLLLDGKIGVKVSVNAEEAVSDLTLTKVAGTENYVDFGENSYAIFYLNPKDVSDASVEFSVSYTDEAGEKTRTYTVKVADYINALKKSSDTSLVSLITAFEVYFNSAKEYFDTTVTEVEALDAITESELADLTNKAFRKKTGTAAGLEFSSTSLILEEDTCIRHYFKVTDEAITTDADLEKYTVVGGTSLKLTEADEGTTRYAYTDIESLASNELSTVKTVTITDASNGTFTVEFNALAYVELLLEDENTKLQNLVKALYRYSVASDAYIN